MTAASAALSAKTNGQSRPHHVHLNVPDSIARRASSVDASVRRASLAAAAAAGEFAAELRKYGCYRWLAILERVFFRWGRIVATYPLVIIFVALAATGLSCVGLLRWK